MVGAAALAAGTALAIGACGGGSGDRLVVYSGRTEDLIGPLLEDFSEDSGVAIDVRYGDGPNETLDVFPADRPGAPVLVFIHGGYWRGMDKSEHSFVAPAFTQSGACVVVPNYELCPKTTIPGIALQMVQALAWTWRNIAQYGGDPSWLVVVGHSYGGYVGIETSLVGDRFDGACLVPAKKGSTHVDAFVGLDANVLFDVPPSELWRAFFGGDPDDVPSA